MTCPPAAPRFAPPRMRPPAGRQRRRAPEATRKSTMVGHQGLPEQLGFIAAGGRGKDARKACQPAPRRPAWRYLA